MSAGSARAGAARLDVGAELRPLRVTLRPQQVRRYALALGMPGARFLSDEEARAEGLPGQIVPGNLSLTLFARFVARSFPGARLRRLSATFRGLVRPGQALMLRGVVTEIHHTGHGDVVECDLVLEGDDGERRVTGTASLEVAAAGRRAGAGAAG